MDSTLRRSHESLNNEENSGGNDDDSIEGIDVRDADESLSSSSSLVASPPQYHNLVNDNEHNGHETNGNIQLSFASTTERITSFWDIHSPLYLAVQGLSSTGIDKASSQLHTPSASQAQARAEHLFRQIDALVHETGSDLQKNAWNEATREEQDAFIAGLFLPVDLRDNF